MDLAFGRGGEAGFGDLGGGFGRGFGVRRSEGGSGMPSIRQSGRSGRPRAGFWLKRSKNSGVVIWWWSWEA